MRDVEILLRYYAFRTKLGQYTGNLKKFLDDTANELNEAWPESEDKIRGIAEECNRAIQATFEVFGSNSFYRWSRGDYEGRFNRAVFDVMTYYFRDESVANNAMEDKQSIERAFKELCESNAEFVESIQTTTKTPAATHLRLSAWGETLQRAIGTQISIPSIENNRIIP